MKRHVLELIGASMFAAALGYAQAAYPQSRSSNVHVWLVDAQGGVDGVLLRDGRSLFFPREVGRNVVLAVRLGDPVRIDGDHGRRVLINERTDSQVDVTPVARGGGPGTASAMERIVARGEVRAFVRGPNGRELTGFILGTGEQVRVAPALGARLGSLRLGDVVAVEGMGTRGPMGTGLVATSVRDWRGDVLASR